MGDFKREERYIVVKLKRIDEDQVEAIRDTLVSYHIPTEECVVVEHDWPIYGPTWDAVQRLAEGRPQAAEDLDGEIAELNGRLAGIRTANDMLQKERDELAARCDRLEVHLRCMFEQYGTMEGKTHDQKLASGDAFRILSETPAASLAHVRANAIEQSLDGIEVYRVETVDCDEEAAVLIADIKYKAEVIRKSASQSGGE